MRTRRAVLGLLAAAPAFAARAGLDPGVSLASAARRQVGVTTGYDPAYRRIAYPEGDVPRASGVCADVIIRAVRDAWRLDLQRLVHEDMARDFPAYPRRWALSRPDANIDHRRVPNLETYWSRQGALIWRARSRTGGAEFPAPLAPGYILTWRLAFHGVPHVALVAEGGRWPRIVQNIGGGAHDDLLAGMEIHAAEAHYRWRQPLA